MLGLPSARPTVAVRPALPSLAKPIIDPWWRCERKALHIGRLLVINAQSFAKISEVTAAARKENSDNED
jgi:hypothetical protein